MKMSVSIRGKQNEWVFTFDGDPKYLDEWRADGLEVYAVENIIPAWLPAWLTGPFCFAQDIIFGNWKRPGGVK